MRELDQHIKEDKTVIQAEVKKQLKLIGRIKLHRGQKVFKYLNGVVSELGETDFFESVIDLNNRRKVRKIKPEQDAIYVAAINLKNAERKISKLIK